MRRYRIELRPAASRALRKLDPQTARRIEGALLLLSDNPRPPSARRLQGVDGLLRVRTGDFRILYQVDDDVLLVLVVTLAHRREIYDRGQ